MGFSITSAVLGGFVIICYSAVIASCPETKGFYRYARSELKNYDPKVAISAMIIIIGIVEFVIGIWAAICCCLINSCAYCVPRQQVRIPEKTTKRTIPIIPLAETF